MYFRYFMWNFSGRQNDNQWKFDVENGNWLSGIKYIDEIRLGSQETFQVTQLIINQEIYIL